MIHFFSFSKLVYLKGKDDGNYSQVSKFLVVKFYGPYVPRHEKSQVIVYFGSILCGFSE
jgi:hypothetical protein